MSVGRIILLLTLVLLFGVSGPIEAGETNRASLKISNYGIFGNRQLKKLLLRVWNSPLIG